MALVLSKPSKGSKQKGKVVAVVQQKGKKSENTYQKLIKGVATTGVLLAQRRYLPAAWQAASTLYDMSESPSERKLTTRSVAAPVMTGTTLRGSTGVAPDLKPLGRGRYRMVGTSEVMQISATTTTYSIRNAFGNSVTSAAMSASQNMSWPFVLSVQPHGVGYVTSPAVGYPDFLCPPQISNFGRNFLYYRYENVRFRFITQCATSDPGQVTLAWAPTEPGYTNSSTGTSGGGGTYAIWGSDPSSSMTLSQCPVYAQGPAWQSFDISFSPRRHGINEGDGMWSSVRTSAVPTGADTLNTQSGNIHAGFLRVALVGFSNSGYLVNRVIGYVVMDYDITFHEMGPALDTSYVYGLSNFIQDPCNKDLYDELMKRKIFEDKSCGGDLDAMYKHRKMLAAPIVGEVPTLVEGPGVKGDPVSGPPVPSTKSWSPFPVSR